MTTCIQRLTRVLERLRRSRLKVKLSKCRFAQAEVEYLGHVVSAEGVKTDPRKTKAVQEYPVPSNVKQLRQFLGLTNYYRRFVKDYAKIAGPLHELTRKTSRGFHWGPSCQQAFEILKKKLTSSPILAYPDFSLPFLLQTDASDTAIGAVLSQVQEGQEHVIAYWSRRLDKPERNYSTVEREALAAVAALKEFYPYVYGFPCTLLTDHNPLTSLKGLKDVGGRLSRWVMFLQQFNLQISYKPGKTHTNADALSRTVQDNSSPSITTIHCSDTLDMTRSAQNQDNELVKLIEGLENGSNQLPPDLAPGLHKAYLKNGVLCRTYQDSSTKLNHTQLVVPSSLKDTVLTHIHNQAGHLGVTKTIAKIKERYYWPGYQEDAKKWIQECDECQRRNPPTHNPRAPLGTLVANRPFEKVTWDIMGPLPTSSRGNAYILIVTDVFTKWVEAFPLRNTIATTLARVLVDEVICRYGVPDSIHSDQGANFGSEVLQAVCCLLGMNRTRTTAYHPMGNGQVERFNRTVEAMLSKMVKENQRDWDSQLPKALFAYRTAIQESTGFTPYHLNFGRTPSLPIEVMLGHVTEDQVSSYPEFVQLTHSQLRSAQQLANKNLRAAHRRQKALYDQRCQGEELRVGDRVWLYCPAVKPGRTKKFASLWRGPYTVIDKTGPVNYKIRLIGGLQTMIVHRNRLKLCYSSPPSCKTRPLNVQKESLPLVPAKESTLSMESTNAAAEANQSGTPAPLYSDIVAGRTSVDECTTDSCDVTKQHSPRPQRNRKPPLRYGNFVSH